MSAPFDPHNEKLEPSHVRVLTGTIITKDFDGNNVGALRNTTVNTASAR